MATQHRIYLTESDRKALSDLLHAGISPARAQTKARILLLTDQNREDRLTDKRIIALLGTSTSNIQRTRMSFLSDGLKDCLKDKPRSGRPPRITGDVNAQLVVLACSDPPTGHRRWTLQLLADHLVLLGHIDTISKMAVHVRLKKTNLSLGR